MHFQFQRAITQDDKKNERNHHSIFRKCNDNKSIIHWRPFRQMACNSNSKPVKKCVIYATIFIIIFNLKLIISNEQDTNQLLQMTFEKWGANLNGNENLLY